MTTIPGKGYGVLVSLMTLLARPERTPPLPARPYERDRSAWVLVLVGVAVYAGIILVEGARLH